MSDYDAFRKVIEHEANQDDDGGFFARLGGIEPDPDDHGPTAKGLFQHLGPGVTAELGRRLDDALAQYQPRPAWASNTHATTTGETNGPVYPKIEQINHLWEGVTMKRELTDEQIRQAAYKIAGHEMYNSRDGYRYEMTVDMLREFLDAVPE